MASHPLPPTTPRHNPIQLQVAVDAGKLEAKRRMDGVAVVAAGVSTKWKDGVRLIGKGALTTAVTLKIAGASKSALEAVEKAGGSVELPAAKPAPLDKEAAKAERAKARAAKAKA